MKILSKNPLVLDFEEVVITVKHPNKSTPEILESVEKALGELIKEDYLEFADSYQPESCRPAPEVKLETMYGIGEYTGTNAGMWDGPHPSLEHMLNRIGKSNNSVIFKLPEGEPMYQWNDEQSLWSRYPKE